MAETSPRDSPARLDARRFRRGARAADRVRHGAGRGDRHVGRVDHRRRARARRRRGARIHGAVRPRQGAQRRRAGIFRRGPQGARSTACPRDQRDALAIAAERIRAYHERQQRGIVVVHRSRRHAARPERHAARAGRHLCSRRQGGVSVVGADERAAGECRRRVRDHHGRPDAGRRQKCAGARRGATRRRHARVRDRRCAGHRGARLRYGDDSRGRQDRRPRQCLCGRGQAPRVRRGRHRHDRRPVGDPGHRRRQRESGLDRDGPVLAGRARRGRAGDPALAGCRAARRGRGEHRASAADDAAPGHRRQVARAIAAR